MPELSLTQADNGKSFEVERGDVVVIRLKENPTTGYVWEAEEADERLSSSRSLSEDGKIGGESTRIFTFKAKTSETTHIQLKQWREWVGDESIIGRFNVTIVVRN